MCNHIPISSDGWLGLCWLLSTSCLLVDSLCLLHSKDINCTVTAFDWEASTVFDCWFKQINCVCLSTRKAQRIRLPNLFSPTQQLISHYNTISIPPYPSWSPMAIYHHVKYTIRIISSWLVNGTLSRISWIFCL
jgi:hypothetical protein